jgi:hypothetical protein
VLSELLDELAVVELLLVLLVIPKLDVLVLLELDEDDSDVSEILFELDVDALVLERV